MNRFFLFYDQSAKPDFSKFLKAILLPLPLVAHARSLPVTFILLLPQPLQLILLLMYLEFIHYFATVQEWALIVIGMIAVF